ncbi:unnamed protein product [Lactuca virosa]|uniref:MULE transposase domain-containing protein n=1 Tax=Lactuca virosa TaxID=75947 RepID=A0AAU9M977_9ASTR|nr:unnamed protein product [Lactuca virosa]
MGEQATSPIIERIPTSKFKLKLKYGGYFRLMKNSCRQIYCFGSQKCIHIDTFLYTFSQLHEEVVKRYSLKNNPKFSIFYVDKYAPEKSLIVLDSDEKFMAMLVIYGSEKQVTIYVTTKNNHGSNSHTNHFCANRDEPHDEYDADLFPSEESYHSHLSSDNEDDLMNDDEEVYSSSKNSIIINKGGNKHATQGWIANVVTDKLKSDGEVSPHEPRNWIMKTYNVDVPYLKVFRGKEQAYTDMYEAYSRGFVPGCRLYIGLDACHLKGKFNGVLAAATGIDETFNSWIGKLCYKPVLDLLDASKEKIMKQFDKKRNLVNTWNDTLVPIAKNNLNDIAKFEIPVIRDEYARHRGEAATGSFGRNLLRQFEIPVIRDEYARHRGEAATRSPGRKYRHCNNSGFLC